MDRANQKLAIAASIEQRQREAVITNWSKLSEDAQLIHRSATLTGTWAAQHTVYLENRQMDAQPGFFVVTPLVSPDGSRAIAVQRGWIPRDRADRTKLAAVETPSDPVTLTLRLAPPPARLYEFEAQALGAIRQNLALNAWRDETKLPLNTALSAFEIGQPSSGLKRDWPQIESGVAKHHGYAAQWFGLAALTAVLWVWFQVVVPRRRNRTSAT